MTLTVKPCAKKIKAKGQFVRQKEWEHTDRRTDTTDRITFPSSPITQSSVRLNAVHFAALAITNLARSRPGTR